jgi:putative hydrolase of the HAD superfamily
VRGWLAELGITPTDALVALWFEAEDRHVAAWHRGEVGFGEQRRNRLREILPVVGDDAALDSMFAAYLRHYERGWRRFDDVDGSLAHLQDAGIAVAVLTNGAAHQQHRKLAAVGLAGRVGPVFCCDALGVAKPDPRAFLDVCRHLGVAPERALHVGDRHDLDVVAARAAGLPAVHLDRDGRGPADEPRQITSLGELDRFLVD